MFIKLSIIILLLFILTFNIMAALPTKADLVTMDYSFQGQPFVELPSKDSVTLITMDYAFQAQPFVRLYEIAVAGWTHKWNTATISKWNTATFTKWNGLQ